MNNSRYHVGYALILGIFVSFSLNAAGQCETPLSKTGQIHLQVAEALLSRATTKEDSIQATEEYMKVLESDPSNATIYLKLGRLYTMMNGEKEFNQAEYCFKKCKEVCADSADIVDLELYLLHALREKYERYVGTWGFCDDWFEPVIKITYSDGKYIFQYVRERDDPDVSEEILSVTRNSYTEVTFSMAAPMDLRNKLRKEKFLKYRGNCNRNADPGYPTTGNYYYNKKIIYSTVSYSIEDSKVIQKGISYHVDYYNNGTVTYAETVNNWGREWILVKQQNCY